MSNTSNSHRVSVLLLFSSSHLGGAERSLSRMAFASKEVAYQLATLCGEGPWCDWVRSQGRKPLVLGCRRAGALSIFVAFWRLIWHVRSHSIDVIYVCGVRAAFFLRFLRILMPGVKLVHGVRWNPDSDSRLDRLFRLVERISPPLVDAWITNSEVATRTLVSRCNIPAERVFVIYNGLDSLPTEVPPIDDRPLEVLTVANLNPRNGHRGYLQVVREVIKVVPDAKFVFVGRDDMNGEIQRAIEDAGLSGYISCEGFQPDVTPWLKQARLMVLPSLWGEGCPTSILEGFSYGLPVVAYAIDGIPELIDDGINGFVVPPNEPADLARAIVCILKNHVMTQSMGIACREKVSSHFTLARCADEHVRIFSVKLFSI
ncbi:glycosyltransferase family 4 protein [Haematospirillum jordaniae]|uniref:glycosyltransferase family 4 protein n=1 Tax=Haematospirillum jordaniae TaxID=1549855 RepID=UPI001432BFDE|nr:glycosyltransferase family 4 protein [Haematospirillum jordaniae]NKD92819.1 glycosyltransferase family 4 protein [Haematospirillum jordaniae]